jgi:hypothetical protein
MRKRWVEVLVVLMTAAVLVIGAVVLLQAGLHPAISTGGI